MDFRREEERNLERFNQYVMNDIPIRLIRISDMTFFERDDVRKHFEYSVSADLEDPSIVVKYAILSHRWNAEEPTYEEMKSGMARGRPGYQKLKKFCEMARAFYHVEFAWSDTCCIDKSSSTEIDESIRSMFRWYLNSDICIVHLAQSVLIQDILRDEWTRRGWTLQELLAPRRIRLFNKRWEPMTEYENDKTLGDTEVMMNLGRATDIHLDDLRTFHPGPTKVAERMTWAAKRDTTRVEDVAYSLMGIFDVSLQIAYGEGGDRAFSRLIEAIMKAGDPSVLNWNWVNDPAKHHSSIAIPQSPKAYLGRALKFPHLGERLEMRMTSLGLRVPLVILPLRVSSTDDRRSVVGYDVVTLECSLCPAATTYFHDFSTVPLYTHQFAFGIVNYSVRSSQLPRIRGNSTGFILYRGPEGLHLPRVTVCKPRSEDFIGNQLIPPPTHEFDAWKRVPMTGLKQIDFPNIPSDSFFYFVTPEYLELVFL